YARIAGADLGVLTHTWFLAVMAHFYLLWPIVMARIPKRRRIAVVGTLFALAVVWRVVAIAVMSPGWVYNATDTNAAALLAGCLLAVVRPRSWRFAGLAIPALAVGMVLPVFGEQGAAFFWGGFAAIALGVLAVQYAVQGAGWMGAPVMGWIGEISYGLYLWHYVFLTVGVGAIPTLIISTALATASYYLIEKPAPRWAPGRLAGSSRCAARPARRISGRAPGRGSGVGEGGPCRSCGPRAVSTGRSLSTPVPG